MTVASELERVPSALASATQQTAQVTTPVHSRMSSGSAPPALATSASWANICAPTATTAAASTPESPVRAGAALESHQHNVRGAIAVICTKKKTRGGGVTRNPTHGKSGALANEKDGARTNRNTHGTCERWGVCVNKWE